MNRFAALGALVLALAVPDAIAQPSPSEVVDAFHYALKAGDRRRALEHLTADVLVFEQGRIEKSRTEYARNHLAEDIRFAATTQRSVSRRSTKIQANTAWVMSMNRNRGKFNGRPVDFTTSETMVLARIAGKWRIVHIHWSFNDESTH